MKSLWHQAFLSMSSDEVEGYPCPKRIKIENNHRSVEKEEQHDLEQSTYCMDANRKSPNKPIYLLKGSLNFSENALGLDMENNGRERKSNKYDLMDFKPWIKEKLECKLLANELLSKKWNIENLEHNVIRDECLMKVNGHSSKAGLCDMRNVNKMSELKQVQEQLNTNIEEDNTNKNHNELKLNASLSSLNTDLFQMKASSQKIGTDDKWKKYQLLDVPFLCGINSTFCEIKNKDSKCLKISPAEENKNHYDNDNKPIEQTGNKDKKSLHSFPTLNLVKNIQAFKIPQNDFFVKGNIIKCSNSSNTLNSKMVSTISQEMEQKNFKNQTYVMQCENTDCSPNISAIGKRKFQNDKNIVNVDSVCFEFNESNHQSAHKQKTWASAEGEKISETNFRNVINSIKCNQMFAKKNIKKKELGNVEGDEDRESKLYLSVHTYVGSRTTQNGTFSNSSNILKRTQGKVRNEDVMFNIQETSVALISEVVRNRDLNINYDMHCVNYNRNLHESELKPPAGKIVKIKRYLSKSIVTKGNCPSSTTWDLSDPRDIDCTLKQKILIKLKIFHDVLLGGLRTRSGFLTKELLKYQENDIITGWFHLHEKLNSTEQYSITEVITSINDNSHIYLQDTISEQQNVNRIKSYFASFSYIINPSDPAEKEYIPVEKNLLYYRKQIQVNSHISNILKGNTEPQQKCITYPGISLKVVKNVGVQLPYNYHKIHYSSNIAEKMEVSFLHKSTLLHNQQKVSPEESRAKQQCLLSRGSAGMHSIISVFDSKEKDTKRQLVVANRLILPRHDFDNSFLWKINSCGANKLLTETNLRLLKYLPSISKMKFKKLNNKYSNPQIQVARQKQKKKQIKTCNIAFPKEKFKTLHSVLNENKKYRHRRVTNSVNFAHEATHFIPKYLRTFDKVNFDKNEHGNYTEFQKKSCSSLSKIPFFPIFDTYEKIPLSAYSEEMDQVPFVKQINSSNEKCLGGKTVTIKKNVHNAPATSNICVLPKFSTSIVNYNSELLPGSRRNKAKYSQEINTYSQYLENESKYIDFPNAGSNSGNIICCILDNDQCATLPFYCDSFRDKDVERKTEEGHCGSSLNDDTKKPFGEMDKILQDGTVRSSEVSNSNICSKVQREEIMAFSVYEDTQTDRNLCTPNSKPMLMKQSLEDLQEVGEISSGQNHVINKSHHPMILYGSRSTNLILSYSKDESVLCVASQNKLVPCLSIMDNGYSENMTDQHLPSESKNISEFELKSTFDLVLEELCMFHEISKEHENKLPKVETNIIQENPSTLTDSGRIGENLKSISPTRACISFPISASMAGQNISKNNQSSFKRKILNRDVKQDTPHECCPSIVPDQELLYSLPEEGYVDSSSKNQLQWNPVLLSHMFMKERSDSLQKERGNCLSHEIIRVQPLKTCRGPIRIGLSRKAKPKKLHPYLK